MNGCTLSEKKKTFANLWKKDFCGENFHGLLAGAKRCHDPKGKLSRIATKPQNSQKFSPSKVSHYTVASTRAYVPMLGVRILWSKIRELCYALMLTIYANYAPEICHYAPQISHYAPEICHYASKLNFFLSHRPPGTIGHLALADTVCSSAQHWSCLNSRRHLPPSLQRLLHRSRLS